MKNIFTIFIFLTVCSLGTAQVVINEFSASNLDTDTDAFGDRSDWIELYNAGGAPVNLQGYSLSDNPNNPTKWSFTSTFMLPAGGFIVVYASNRDTLYSGEWHTNFKITQTDEEPILLSDPLGNLIESVVVQPAKMDHSRGKSVNGNNEWVIFTDPTPGSSNNNAEHYLAYADKPIVNVDGGFYYPNATVTIEITPPAGTVVRYTLNGEEPSNLSATYNEPISLMETRVLRASAFSQSPDILPSFNVNNTYFINEIHTIPVISIAGRELDDLMDGDYSDPIGSFEFFKNDSLVDEAEGEFNKHGNDSWAYDQRGIDWITRDQMGYNDAIHDQIFPTKTRDRFQRLILKAAANDNYPFEGGGAHIRDAYVHALSDLAGLELDERVYEPCILYVNGEYWGVYEIREKADDSDYTKYYYDQDEFDIDFIKTWGGTWEEYGSWDDWYDLKDFIDNNDMADPDNYAYVTERFEVLSLIDYMILNTFVVCKDWLNWNTAWWRGRDPDGDAQKWRYVLWDEDATFDHYINYTGIPDPSPFADPCDNEQIGSDFEGHVDIAVALLHNPDFHSLYVNRFADMLNTYFSCDYMNTFLDELITRIEPEMERHTDRWGGNVNQWMNNVEFIHDFINTRCEQVIDNGIVDCYDVTGPFPVTIDVQPAGSPNDVFVNTFIPQAYPFTGEYFGDVTMNLTAIPAVGWEFDHWVVNGNTFTPDEEAAAIQIAFQTGGDMTAFFIPLVPCAAPSGLYADTTGQFTVIGWQGINNSISYEVQYRILGETDWNIFSNIATSVMLTSLEACTPYELRLRAICGNGYSTYLEFNFQTACAVSSAEVSEINQVSVFPNPFTDRIQVEFLVNTPTDAEVQLFDVTGKILYSENMSLTEGKQQISVEPAAVLPDGVYMLAIRTKNCVVNYKVVRAGL